MEGSSNPEATQNKPELVTRVNTKVSDEIWQDLLHTAIVGNGIFPQSFFAQGILLADKMANLVHQRTASFEFITETESFARTYLYYASRSKK